MSEREWGRSHKDSRPWKLSLTQIYHPALTNEKGAGWRKATDASRAHRLLELEPRAGCIKRGRSYSVVILAIDKRSYFKCHIYNGRTCVTPHPLTLCVYDEGKNILVL